MYGTGVNVIFSCYHGRTADKLFRSSKVLNSKYTSRQTKKWIHSGRKKVGMNLNNWCQQSSWPCRSRAMSGGNLNGFVPIVVPLIIRKVLCSNWKVLCSNWKVLFSNRKALYSNWKVLYSNWKVLYSNWKVLITTVRDSLLVSTVSSR